MSMKKVNIMRKCEGSTKISQTYRILFPIFLYMGCNIFFLSHNKPNQTPKQM